MNLFYDTGPPQRNDAYSILDSTFHIDTTELEDKNSDLQEIIKHLEKNRPHADGSFAGDINRMVSGVPKISVAKGLNRPPVPSQRQNDVTVGMAVMWPEGQEQLPSATATGLGGSQGNPNTTGIQRSSEASSETSDENPLRHYMNFIRDDVLNTPALNQENVVPYHPEMEEVENNEPQFKDSLYDQLDNHALYARLPDFEKLMGSSSDPTGNDDDDDASGEDEPEAPFDFKKQFEEVKKKYLTPTEEKERNPLIPTLPLVIESLFTTSQETRPTYSLTDSVTSNEGTNVSGMVSTEIHAGDSQGIVNVFNAGNTELVENQHLGEDLDTEQAEASVASTVEMIPASEGNRFPSGDELFKSGDELFKSGPGDVELVGAMDRMSIAANTSVAATESEVVVATILTPSLNSPGLRGDEDLFGPFSLKEDDANKLDVQQPVFPPICSPSRNAETTLRQQVIGEARYHHQSLFAGTTEQKSTWSSSNTNNNAKQTSALMQPPTLNHTRLNLQPVSYDTRGQYNMGLQMPSTAMQPKYQASPGQYQPMTNPPYQLPFPYSFAGQPTRNPPMDPFSLPVSQSSPSLPKRASSNPDEHKTPTNYPRNDARNPKNKLERRPSENPGVENPRSKFIVGSASSTSSSGEINPSPVFPPLNSGSPEFGVGVRDASLGSSVTSTQLKNTESPQLSTVGLPLQSTAMPQASVSSEAPFTLYNRNISSANSAITSYNTSTPIITQRKGKQEKDAMNEMLKSYKSTHGPIEEDQMVQLTPPQQSTPSTSPRLPRQRLHLDMNPQGPTVGTVHHARSAPTLERRTSYPSDHHRVSRHPQSATPPRGGNRWPSSSPGSGSESTSAKSQFERQAEALGKYRKVP